MHEDVLLELLFERGPIARPELARLSSLSKPSVSDILDTFVKGGIARVAGSSQGRSGPAAALFEVDPNAAHAIGVDLRDSKITCVIGDLDGVVLAERSMRTGSSSVGEPGSHVLRMCRELIAESGASKRRIGHVAIGVPGIIDPQTGSGTSLHRIPGYEGVRTFQSLQEELDVTLTLDNDVNMAAEAERFRSDQSSRENFVYVAIGTGIGMAIVLDGEVRRGHKGAAGEIAFIPIGADPFDRALQVHGSLEESVNGAAILRNCERLRDRGIPTALAMDADVPAIFAAAEAGDSLAEYVVDDEARMLALAAITVASVVDPERIILGGGIGEAPGLLPRVREWGSKLSLRPPHLERSTLGNRATLLGALGVAVSATRSSLLPMILGNRPQMNSVGHKQGSFVARRSKQEGERPV